jgi:hypothetical protein
VRGYDERVANGYTVSRFVDLRADYGHQLLHLPGDPKLGQVLHASLTVVY